MNLLVVALRGKKNTHKRNEKNTSLNTTRINGSENWQIQMRQLFDAFSSKRNLETSTASVADASDLFKCLP